MTVDSLEKLTVHCDIGQGMLSGLSFYENDSGNTFILNFWPLLGTSSKDVHASSP